MSAPTVTEVTQQLWQVHRMLGLNPMSCADRLRVVGRPIDLGMAEQRCVRLLSQFAAANDAAISPARA